MTDQTLSRLRAANPCPAATPADADALFDRIVLAPADRRLARTTRPRYRRPLLVIAAVLVACGLLASAAYGISSWLGQTIAGPTVKSEYADAQKQLVTPPGYAWPALHWPANSVTSRGAGGGYAVAID